MWFSQRRCSLLANFNRACCIHGAWTSKFAIDCSLIPLLVQQSDCGKMDNILAFGHWALLVWLHNGFRVLFNSNKWKVFFYPLLGKYHHHHPIPPLWTWVQTSNMISTIFLPFLSILGVLVYHFPSLPGDLTVLVLWECACHPLHETNPWDW
jgi:hypothetical protein